VLGFAPPRQLRRSVSFDYNEVANDITDERGTMNDIAPPGELNR